MNQSFSREKRLLNAHQFKAVFDSPDFRLSGRCVLLLARFNQLKHHRLGLVIGKKNIKLSVERNRVKRQIREHFRTQELNFLGVDVVIIARKGLADLSNSELQHELTTLWKRLLKQCNAKSKASLAAPVGNQNA